MKEAAQEPKYAIARDPDGTHVTQSQGGRLRGQFDQRGARLNPSGAGGQTRLDAKAIGCVGALETVEPAEPVASSALPNRLTYARRAGKIHFTEEWTSGQPGLEQKFIVNERPCKGRELVIELAADGLTPELRDSQDEGVGTSVELRDSAGILRFQYSELHAYDAAGEALPARMRITGERIALHVETVNARWPVVVDPLVVVAEGELSRDFAGTNSQLGTSVALSEDGKTALVGAPGRGFGVDQRVGAVYVFVQQDEGWNWQTTLVGSNCGAGDEFGFSLALSGDTALVGVPGRDIGGNTSQGSAVVFRRSGSDWVEQNELKGSLGHAFDKFGFSVALEGNTALIGAPQRQIGDNLKQGSAYVFVRSGNDWVEQQELRGSSSTAYDEFGFSVALSGETALVGAPNTTVDAGGYDNGRAYVFVRSGSAWVEQEELGGGTGGAIFGFSVALSGDTALVGKPDRLLKSGGRPLGSAYVFVRIGTDWVRQAALDDVPRQFEDGFGTSVRLSGEIALIGAPKYDFGDNSDQGSTAVFVRTGSDWVRQTEFGGSLGAAGDQFGSAVALGGDTVLVGAPHQRVGENPSQGAAHLFVHTASGWTEQQQLSASLGAANDRFASSLVVSGAKALVGAPGRKLSGDSPQGSAIMFSRRGNHWVEHKELFLNSGTAGDMFGSSVALSVDTALVGAPYREVVGSSSEEEGSAVVFLRNGDDWGEQQEFSDRNNDVGQYGSSVALSGNTALVGAPGRTIVFPSRHHGTAVLLVRRGSDWTRTTELYDPLATPYDHFGSSVAISSDTLLIGAPGRGKHGSVYVFGPIGTDWVQQKELSGDSSGASGNNFGSSVALAGDTALIGAPYRQVGANQSQGSAYVFVRRGGDWEVQKELFDNSGAAGDRFGSSVVLSGDIALVGAPGRRGEGAAYVFVRSGSGWMKELEISPTSSATGEAFGSVVSLSENKLLVGAPDRNVRSNVAQGTAYAYRLRGVSGEACSVNDDCASSYFCVDGVCCTTACVGFCEVCSAARGATKDGACTPMAAGAVGDPPCPNNVFCDGASGDCPTGCTSDALCPPGTYCAWGACQSKRAQGGPCEASNECTTAGGCVDQVCCNEPCTGACEACSAALSTGPNGTCSPASRGTPGTPACVGEVLCDGLSRACLGACTMDAHCASSQYCETAAGKCQPQKNRGIACAASNECSTPGGCVDGVCCNTPCTGRCQACAAAAKTAGVDGECGNAKVGTDPHDQCTRDSITSCNQDGYCDGAGDCAYYDNSTVCGIPVCVGNESRPQVCFGPMHCSSSAAGTSCSPYRCNPSTGDCLTTCLRSNECAGNTYCDPETSHCIAKKEDGATCSDGTMCSSSYCVDSVCCDTECAGTCVACSAKKKGQGLDGDCQAVASGTDPDDECPKELAASCGTNGLCDGSGACAFWFVGTDCSEIPGTNICDGNRVVGRLCIGPNKCALKTEGLDCAPQKCASGSCANCAIAQDCADPNATYCDAGGQCKPRKDQGAPCGENSECLSKHCVDGVCCESDCAGQCQWCGDPSLPGICQINSNGTPRGNRLQCPGAGTPCGGRCDGSQGDGCSFPGRSTECGKPAGCVGDFVRSAAVCDGAGACPAGELSDCGVYACDAQANECKTSCNKRSDCRLGAVCDTSQDIGSCNAEGAKCRNAYEIESVDGTVVSCRGYACLNGACQQQCGSDFDCAPGHICRENACLIAQTIGSVQFAGAPSTSQEESAASDVDDGCSCRLGHRQERPLAWLTWIALAAATWAMRRRRRRPEYIGDDVDTGSGP